jgi:(E)-4-hydroxy-3-methylbut-2-enyl-diphosphate synthase
MQRKNTKTIKIGNTLIGGNNPVTIQSMCNTKTVDVKATVNQIKDLTALGCEIIRVAVPDQDSAKAIKDIKSQITIPLIADIHFDYKLAITAIESGVDALRLNPGNIGRENNVKAVIERAKERRIPIRIGVNSGSLQKDKLAKYGVCAQAIVESALEHVAILERLNYDEIKISVKASSVPLTIESYRLLSQKCDYPLHLGVTESGTEFAGTIKSSIGIGTLLAEGIGDTIRVSLTADPLREIAVAKQILKALGLRKGLEFISCPTCGRTQIPLIELAQKVETELAQFDNLELTIAVMGCEVNGPGEAKEADFGIAGGRQSGLIFRKGEIIKKVPEDRLLDELIISIKEYIASQK